MKRRNFLRLSGPLAFSPFVLNGIPYKTFATPGMLAAFDCEGIGDRVLVMVQMAGGNDGVNTVIPIEQYDTYANLRPNIAIPQPNPNSGIPGYIELDTTLALEDQVGLHPGMQAVKDLYDQGKVNVIQAVSYDLQNRSHFKSTDLYMTGGDGTPENFNFSTGWMGRYLDHQYPGLAGNPNEVMPDPLGIQVGNPKPSLGFHTEGEHSTGINLTGQNPEGFYDLISEIGGAPLTEFPSSEYGTELEYIMNIENSTSNYAERISTVFEQGTNVGAYPNSYLANQLKTVARLIDGGSKTKIYLVNIGGFDTHVNQTDAANPTIGAHSNLMTQLSEAIKAFQDDLNGLGHEDKVLTVTFSEFGRKPIENGNIGTDHGTLAPMFVFGSALNAGITGTNVNLSDLAGSNQDQLQNHQYDYRQVFTTLLQDWLGADDEAIFQTKFEAYLGSKLPFISTEFVVDPGCYLAPLPVELSYFKAVLNDNEKEVLLEWKTAMERNSDYYDVERSQDGVTFEAIARVTAAGESVYPTRYTEIDYAPLLGQSYYRLRQVDRDGAFTFSEVRAIDRKEAAVQGFKLYPNPARFDINLVATSAKSSSAYIRIVDAMGVAIQYENVTVKEGFNKYNFPVNHLSAGNYILIFESQYLNLHKSFGLTVQK